MNIENKESYILISSDENTFSEFYALFLEKVADYKENHIIVQISDKTKATKEDFLLFLDIANQKKEDKTSFIIIANAFNMDDFPENFNIVPTLIEAEDVLEMENMERELGF
ncbi:hypothetical protein [Polaribacter sp. Hel_I_88]|uniref:hypothetical protein n=1 Tax=Polaribacter sp. Hel_I_88 TaxID=1250006 RepID=UPI00047D9DD1|nr:hypothetical protein [Polaribacter sp. Hel_I_88]